MAEKPEHQQITPTQLERWSNNIVTKTFVQCLRWRYEDFRDANGEGRFVDSSSADTTHATMHLMMGRMEGLTIARDVEELLDEFKMINYPEPEDETEDA